MSSITPTSPLMTLVIKPKGNVVVQDLLGRFHPIMKAMGYGNFEMEENRLYQASKTGNGFLNAALFVFAEMNGESIVVNIDGHSIFGLKGVKEQLQKIQSEYENTINCSTELNGPNYTIAFIGNLLYTALPIYASATIVAVGGYYLGLRTTDIVNVYLYATLGVIGAKTRFWVNQRRKQRPVWASVLLLLFLVPTILAIVGDVLLPT